MIKQILFQCAKDFASEAKFSTRLSDIIQAIIISALFLITNNMILELVLRRILNSKETN